jgi:DNA-binding transcriptional LysR family regulator
LRAAADGLGLAYHFEFVARDRLRRGEVVEVLREFSVATPGFFLYFPARAQVLPKLRALIDWLGGRWSNGNVRLLNLR